MIVICSQAAVDSFFQLARTVRASSRTAICNFHFAIFNLQYISRFVAVHSPGKAIADCKLQIANCKLTGCGRSPRWVLLAEWDLATGGDKSDPRWPSLEPTNDRRFADRALRQHEPTNGKRGPARQARTYSDRVRGGTTPCSRHTRWTMPRETPRTSASRRVLQHDAFSGWTVNVVSMINRATLSRSVGFRPLRGRSDSIAAIPSWRNRVRQRQAVFLEIPRVRAIWASLRPALAKRTILARRESPISRLAAKPSRRARSSFATRAAASCMKFPFQEDKTPEQFHGFARTPQFWSFWISFLPSG